MTGEARVLGTVNSADAYTIRDFLTRSGFPYEWIELRTDAEARKLAGVSSLGDVRLPVCILSEGSVLFHPSTHDLAMALEWFKKPKYDVYDLAIYGAGPAGLSAAVYGASEGLRTIVLEKAAVGGQAGSTSRIENYLGFPEGIPGWELAARARRQAQRLGAEIIITGEGVGGEPRDGWTVSWLASGEEIVARATICATGVNYNRLGLPNEDHFLNRGLFYGAGSSEAALCTGHTFIVGGGNSAGQAAINFSRFASKVTMLVREQGLQDTLSSYLVTEIEEDPKIDVLTSTVLMRVSGDDGIRAVSYRNEVSQEITVAETERVFVCIGGIPRTDWARAGTLLCDSGGYILTGQDLDPEKMPKEWWHDRKPFHMETSMPGLFAAGDVRHNSIKRCATAVGEGATAVSMVHQFLSIAKRKPRGSNL
jgi:thioredoxin reductase (NADPH)